MPNILCYKTKCVVHVRIEIILSLKEVVSELTPFLIDVRRHFHAYPELSGKEFESAKAISHHLTEAGIHWTRCDMETATLAVVEGKGSGNTRR